MVRFRYFLYGSSILTLPILVTFFTGRCFRFDSVARVSAWKSVVGAGLAPCKIHSVALSTLSQVLPRALVSIVVQFQFEFAMYFPADPASLHSFPPCLLYQQRGGLVIVPVKKYRILIIRFFTGIFGRSIGTLTVRRYRCGPLDTRALIGPCSLVTSP